MLKYVNIQCFPPARFSRSYRVTDEALIAKTAIWPMFFFSFEGFFALTGTHFFFFRIQGYRVSGSFHSRLIGMQKIGFPTFPVTNLKAIYKKSSANGIDLSPIRYQTIYGLSKN